MKNPFLRPFPFTVGMGLVFGSSIGQLIVGRIVPASMVLLGAGLAMMIVGLVIDREQP